MTQRLAWSQATHQRIATAIKDARIEKRMSAQDLADETTRLGLPISRNQIANYESGRKHRLDLTELLILAGALDIPPTLLLFPTFPDDTVEALPGQRVDTSRAAAWLSGQSTLAIGPSTPGTELVEAAGRLASIDDNLVRMRGSLEVHSMPPVVADSTKRVIEQMEEQAAAVKEWIVTAKTALWGSDDE